MATKVAQSESNSMESSSKFETLLAYFCGSTLAVAAIDYIDRILSLHLANWVRVASRMPALDFLRDEASNQAVRLPSNWWPILGKGLLFSLALFMIRMRTGKLKIRSAFLLGLAYFLGFVAYYKMWPTPNSDFGFMGYGISFIFYLTEAMLLALLCFWTSKGLCLLSDKFVS